MTGLPLADKASNQPAAFDYASVSDQDRDLLQWTAQTIRRKFSSAQDSILAAGAQLLTIKDRVPHGALGAWVEAELGITLRAAQNYMNAARLVQSVPELIRETVSLLPAATLYKLAAPSAPPVVLDEVVKAAEAGSLLPAAVILRRLDVATAEQREVTRVMKAKPGRSADQAEKIVQRNRAERRKAAEEKEAAHQRVENERRAAMATAVERLVAEHPAVMVEIGSLLKGDGIWSFTDALQRHLRALQANAPGGGE